MLKKIICVVLVCAVLSGSVYYVFELKSGYFQSIKSLWADRDVITAEKISDITGESSKNILKVYSESKSWNDTLEKLKSNQAYERFMSDEELEKIIYDEGFDKNDVKAARETVMQLQFNLLEICNYDNEANIDEPNKTSVGYIDKSNDVQENSKYKELSQSLDANLLIYFCLKLKNEFGSFETIIDEYLYCLQIDVDLSLYITDKKAYEESVMTKAVELMREDAITLQKISDYLLSRLNKKEENDSEDLRMKSKDNKLAADKISAQKINDIVPQIEDPKPQDPTAQIMSEIDKLKKVQ